MADPGEKQKKWGARCPRCGKGLPPDFRSGRNRCGSCGQTFEIARFVPVALQVDRPEAVVGGPVESAPCSRHEANAAVAACARCGTFMCALCRIDSDGQSLCSTCFERLSTEGELRSAETRLKNYGGMALLCLIFSVLCGLGVVAGPLGVYYCIRGLRDKSQRNESDGIAGLYVRLVLCSLFALLGVMQAVGIVMMFAEAGAA